MIWVYDFSFRGVGNETTENPIERLDLVLIRYGAQLHRGTVIHIEYTVAILERLFAVPLIAKPSTGMPRTPSFCEEGRKKARF